MSKVATDQTFNHEVLTRPGVKLVDFWAEWCGPCRQIGPVVEELAEEFAGKAEVFKLDVDANPEVPARFHIRGIPTILIFKDGQLFDQVVGAAPKEIIKDSIERALAG